MPVVLCLVDGKGEPGGKKRASPGVTDQETHASRRKAETEAQDEESECQMERQWLTGASESEARITGGAAVVPSPAVRL